jgi:hypothetical protein
MVIDRTTEFVARIAYNIYDLPYTEKAKVVELYPPATQKAIYEALATLRNRREVHGDERTGKQ